MVPEQQDWCKFQNMLKNGQTDNKETSETVERLRNLLKDKGYLDNRLERFFFRTTLGKTSNLAVNMWLSFIVGVLGSLLMTIPMVLVVVMQNRQLLGNYWDLAVLTVYFFLLFGIAIFILEFIAGLAVGLLQKVLSSSGDMHSKLASQVAYPVIIVVFAYLVFWWKLGGNTSTLLSVIAVSVALILSLVVGKLTSFAASAYSMKLSSFDIQNKAKKVKAGKISFVFLVFILIGAGVLLTTGKKKIMPVADKFNIYNTGIKTVIIGIDGLDYDSLLMLAENGNMPFLEKMINRGNLVPVSLIDSNMPPVVWTGIATGHTSQEHGIKSFDARKIKGISTSFQSTFFPDDLLSSFFPGWKVSERRPVSSIERKRKTFWEIFARKGLHCGVANWWASWPVMECNGFILSERAIHKYDRSEKNGYDICPDDVFEYCSFKDFPSVPERIGDFFRIDYFYLNSLVNISQQFSKTETMDSLCVYLPGLDIFRTKVLAGKLSQKNGATISAIKELDELQTVYCAELDKLIARYHFFSEKDSSDNVFIVIGDPGRSANRKHSSGFMLVVGKVAGNFPDGKTISQYDIVPVILALHGFPSAADMKGKLKEGILSREFIKKFPPFTVSSFGLNEIELSAGESNEFDEEMMENLKSLGYL